MCSTDFCIQCTHWEPSAQTKADYKTELVLSAVRNELSGNVIAVQYYFHSMLTTCLDMVWIPTVTKVQIIGSHQLDRSICLHTEHGSHNTVMQHVPISALCSSFLQRHLGLAEVEQVFWFSFFV